MPWSTVGRCPTRNALGVAPAPFLNGLAEAVGELRRYMLDLLRRGEVMAASAARAMDDIYSLLVTIDYPDALTRGCGARPTRPAAFSRRRGAT